MKEAVGGKFRVLSEEQVEKIHQAALKVLERVGLRVESEKFLKIYSDFGANVDFKTGVVKISPNVVGEALKTVPHRVVLYGRRPEHTMDLSDAKVYLGTGGAAVRILDLETGEARPTTLQDQADLAFLVENLENIHFFQCPVVCADVPKEVVSLNSFYAALSGTTKHVQESATSPEAVDQVIAMASLIAGGEEELLARPFISFVCSWMVSPLRVDVGVAEVLQRVVARGLPVALSSAPVTGSTAPATLSGLLTLVHAEELSGIVLAQAIRKGAPVLYGPVPGATNFRTMGYVGGAVEAGLMNAAAVQLARHIEVPTYSDAGLTEAKVPDIQAGYEKAANIMLVALAGGNFIHHAAGMLESMLAVAPEQYVIDDDICGMALRVLAGIRVDEETTAVEVIEKVGPGGHFLTHPHTLKFARSGEFLLPKTADRSSRADWEQAGGHDARDRARKIAREILARPRPKLIPEEVDSEIRREFQLLLPRK